MALAILIDLIIASAPELQKTKLLNPGRTFFKFSEKLTACMLGDEKFEILSLKKFLICDLNILLLCPNNNVPWPDDKSIKAFLFAKILDPKPLSNKFLLFL